MQAIAAIEQTPVIVRPTQTVADAVDALRSCSQVRAGVVDEDGRLVGLIGMHDVLRMLLPSYVLLDPNLAHALDEKYYAEHYAKLAQSKVREIMVRDFVAVPSDCSLARAIAVMNDQQWQPLPVTEGARFVGMLTRASILRALAESAARMGLLSQR